uniref:Latent membrane protein 2A n=1 Tax=Cercopithecine herpesvirus 12 TaxID=106332 RepID=Q81013_CHV12|nr:latent membrane protein 2A [Papiine gammaherpesvirus 1]prf//2124407A LMP2A gene [Papiine gammaherpesvirus 1]
MVSLEMQPLRVPGGPRSHGGPDGDEEDSNPYPPSSFGESWDRDGDPVPPDYDAPSHRPPSYGGSGGYATLGQQEPSLYAGLGQNDGGGGPPPPYSPRQGSEHVYEEPRDARMVAPWMPVICAPYLFWLAGIAASCFSAPVTAIVGSAGLALTLLILAFLTNSQASQVRKLLSKLTALVAVATWFAILMTYLVLPSANNIIVLSLLVAAEGIQSIYLLVMFLMLLWACRRYWRRLSACFGLLFLLCFLLLILDAIFQRSPLLGAMTVVALTLLILAFLLWLSSPHGMGALGAALLTLAAALALLASLILGDLNLATMFLLLLLWTLVIILICTAFSAVGNLLTRWLLYTLALLLTASALLCGGSILKMSQTTDFFPDLFCMILLITAGILYILAVLAEWGSGSKTFGSIFLCLSGLLTATSGLIWLTLMQKVLLSAWCLTAGCLVFFIGIMLFGVIRFCRCFCFCCLQLDDVGRPGTRYDNVA